jgi:hypothetical protein
MQKKKKTKDKKQSERFIETAKKISDADAEKRFEKTCQAILKRKSR